MILLLILFLLVCSFVLFIASRHDFVLLRQNISIRHIFDKAFITLIFALLLSRAVYLVDYKMFDFFMDPLRFLHVILYFGFSALGLMIAMALGVLLFFRKRKNFLRILDIYLLSFFPVVIFEAVNYILEGTISISISLGMVLLSVIFFMLLIRMHTGFKIKDGVVAFSTLILSSLFYLGSSFLRQDFLIYSPVQILALLIIAISIYCLVLVQIDFFKEK